MIFKLPDTNNCSIGVIGLGYVGLPLALEIAKIKVSLSSKEKLNRKVIGYDLNLQRIEDLQNNYDKTNEITKNQLESADRIIYTSDSSLLAECDIFIVTVPTPINENKEPDLRALKSASQTISDILKLRNNFKKFASIIVYESTVYPGVIEDICVPILQNSGLVYNKQFYCGFSPERINPGDNNRKISNIKKVTSGSTFESAKLIDYFYSSFIAAGTFLTPSIKVAEAAKVIENTQRDINIAFINELAMIFDKLNIDTLDVIEAAATKWNFAAYKPGLVGGHCIGVDPYYLTYCAKKLGYNPKMILSGRYLNDNMYHWLFEKILKRITNSNINLSKSENLILGFTFKENCPDIRNTQVIKIYNKLKEISKSVTIVDPVADPKQCKKEYGVNVLSEIPNNARYSICLLLVAHDEYKNFSIQNWNNLIVNDGFIVDLKGLVPKILNPLRI